MSKAVTRKRTNYQERNGVEFDFGNGTIITAARAGGYNKKFNAIVRREHKKRQHAVDAGLLTIGEERELLATCYADAVVLGWEGVTDGNGEDIPYSRENVIRVLCKRPKLLDALYQACINPENFQ